MQARDLRRGARRAGAAALLVAFAAGCKADRRLVITSQPPGADIRLDGKLVGKTPKTVEFVHYGTRRVSYYLDGYISQSHVVEVKAPWYGRFPLDLVSEVLIPWGWKDVHPVHAELEPGTGAIAEPDLRSVIERAARLRRAGPEGPLPVPEPPDGEP